MSERELIAPPVPTPHLRTHRARVTIDYGQ